VWNFSRFSPLTYGNQWTRKECVSAQWVKTWDFACNELYEDYKLYNTAASKPVVAEDNSKKAPVAVIGGDNDGDGADGAEGGGRGAVVVEEAEHPVAVPEEANTMLPTGVVAEPGRDVFDKEKDLEAARSKSLAWAGAGAGAGGEGVMPSLGSSSLEDLSDDEGEGGEDGELVVNVDSDPDSVEGGDAGEPEPEPAVEEDHDSTSVEEVAVPAGKPEGPVDHAEALADQVAHELYPEARDVPLEE